MAVASWQERPSRSKGGTIGLHKWALGIDQGNSRRSLAETQLTQSHAVADIGIFHHLLELFKADFTIVV